MEKHTHTKTETSQLVEDKNKLKKKLCDYCYLVVTYSNMTYRIYF